MIVHFLKSQFWFTLATKSNLSVEQAKTLIPELAERYKALKVTKNDISPQLLECVLHFIENENYIAVGFD